MRHLFDGDPTGKFSGERAPHAITHGKDEIGRLERRLPLLAQTLQLLLVEPQPDESILIVGANLPAVRTTRPVQAEAGDIKGRGIHSRPSEEAEEDAFSRVANSKSMMQKRPSEPR